jgi:hypothetical protein
MKTSTLALLGAGLCWITAFVLTPVLMLAQMRNPGFIAPTISGLVLMGVWARCMARGR